MFNFDIFIQRRKSLKSATKLKLVHPNLLRHN